MSFYICQYWRPEQSFCIAGPSAKEVRSAKGDILEKAVGNDECYDIRSSFGVQVVQVTLFPCWIFLSSSLPRRFPITRQIHQSVTSTRRAMNCWFLQTFPVLFRKCINRLPLCPVWHPRHSSRWQLQTRPGATVTQYLLWHPSICRARGWYQPAEMESSKYGNSCSSGKISSTWRCTYLACV